MKPSLSILGGALLSVAMVAGCSHTAASDAAAASNSDQNGSKKGLLGSLFETKKAITIPEGSPFEVTLDETLASNRNHAGDLFAASLSQPIVQNGKTIIPAGAHVAGRVVDAKDAGRLHVPARLSVALSSVEVDGKSHDLNTGTIGKTGQNHNKRNLGFIGGGAAGGAIIGALAGGGQGSFDRQRSRRRGRHRRSRSYRQERRIAACRDAFAVLSVEVRDRHREGLTFGNLGNTAL